MGKLIHKEETFRIIGCCMEVHRELGKGHDEVICKDALQFEFSQAGIPFEREKLYKITYKAIILPPSHRADSVVMDKILFEGKAVEQLTEAHVKQVLNYLAASKSSSVCSSTSVPTPWNGDASSFDSISVNS